MNNEDKNKLLYMISEALDEVGLILEEGMYYPPEVTAGSAPRKSALNSCESIIDDLITNIGSEFGVVDIEKVRKGKSISEIEKEINLVNYRDFDELTEVDSFTEDNGERKYNYRNYIFKHNSEKFVRVTIQECAKTETDLDFVYFGETEKKEVVTSIWD